MAAAPINNSSNHSNRVLEAKSRTWGCVSWAGKPGLGKIRTFSLMQNSLSEHHLWSQNSQNTELSLAMILECKFNFETNVSYRNS